MSYPDESDDDHRAAEGRPGGRRRASPPGSGPDERGSNRAQPARPAWDAATYGRPDDMRPPPRRSPPPPEDRYPAEPYRAPDPYPPDPYQSDPYQSDPYPRDGYQAAPPYAADQYAADPYPADPYPAEPDPYPSTSRYPMAPSHAPDSFAPDRYTSFQAEVGEFAPNPSDDLKYVASGLYLDSEDGGPYRAEAEGYPGGWVDPGTPAPAPGRAGRNLPAAIGVGVGLGAAVIASLFLWRPAFLGVVAVAVGVGVWELVRAIRTSGANPPLVPLVAGGALMTGLAWWGQADALTFGLVVTVVAVMVWRLADGVNGYGRDVTAASLVAVYVPFLGGFTALLGSPDDGALRVVATLAAVVLSDTGGYIAGVLFGRHPMAPSVSPKKSWEGLAGSLVATAVGSAILLLLLLDVSIWWGLVFGLAVSAASVVGDLGESMIKRDLGVKDMGTLLPGHGGLMDRLDSIVFAAPTAYLLLAVIAPPV
jgi:phosphatidate cytidylyltransferase